MNDFWDNGFPEDFVWGTATASYQVEGAAREAGRSESVWDVFCRIPGKVHAGENGDVSCDQYHRYAEDIELMAKLGVNAYRFSLAWPRIIPDGRGKVNEAALDYYRRLIDALLEAGIEAYITLYHWDLPQILEERGGWASRDTAFAFAEYARVCFDAFSPKVRRWVTLNEPFCTAHNGYLYGVHAPGRNDPEAAIRAIHHLNLAHGLANEAFREGGYPGELGIVWNLITPRPATRRPEDARAAELSLSFSTLVYTDPVLGRGYPELNWLGKPLKFPVQSDDLKRSAGPLDFIGLNYYFEHAVSLADKENGIPVQEPFWEEATDMGWPINSDGLLRQLRWINERSGGLPLYITENGCACDDLVVLDQTGQPRVHDSQRIAYIRTHLDVCRRAKAEGLPLKGFFMWSFIDNFEWSFGYSKRFGIVYCDYKSLKRIPKDSFYFYRDVIAGYR